MDKDRIWTVAVMTEKRKAVVGYGGGRNNRNYWLAVGVREREESGMIF